MQPLSTHHSPPGHAPAQAQSVESVWWSLAQLYKKDLLYKSHKVVWWWPQGGTALSAGEVGQGYREVADPSVYRVGGEVGCSWWWAGKIHK